MNLYIRELELKDLEDYLFWNLPTREFRKYNGPYYAQSTLEELKQDIETYRKALERREENVLGNKKIIANKDTDEIIGQVNWYWKSKETFWMEVGIVIFNENYWGKGIGTVALTMWINEIFDTNPKLVRIGISTWSGNTNMVHLAKKLGLEEEAVYKKARIVDGKYYDALSYGILKEDWQKKQIRSEK